MEGLKRIIRQSAKVEAELPELTAKRDELEHTLQAMTESLNGATVISKEASDEYNGILREYKKIVAKIDEAKKVVSTKHARDWQLNLLIETLQGLEENPQVFDERLWINIVEKAVVNSKDDIVVTFLGGIEVKVSLEE